MVDACYAPPARRAYRRRSKRASSQPDLHPPTPFRCSHARSPRDAVESSVACAVARGRCSRREQYPWRAAPSGRRTPASRDAQRPKRPNGFLFGAADTILAWHDGRGSAHEERSRDDLPSPGRGRRRQKKGAAGGGALEFCGHLYIVPGGFTLKVRSVRRARSSEATIGVTLGESKQHPFHIHSPPTEPPARLLSRTGGPEPARHVHFTARPAHTLSSTDSHAPPRAAGTFAGGGVTANPSAVLVGPSASIGGTTSVPADTPTRCRPSSAGTRPAIDGSLRGCIVVKEDAADLMRARHQIELPEPRQMPRLESVHRMTRPQSGEERFEPVDERLSRPCVLGPVEREAELMPNGRLRCRYMAWSSSHGALRSCVVRETWDGQRIGRSPSSPLRIGHG